MKMLDIYTISSVERDKILIEHFEEKEIRETNPAVALAWQHYKTLVKLAHSGLEPEPIDETQFG
jgi:hypothetical protein